MNIIQNENIINIKSSLEENEMIKSNIIYNLELPNQLNTPKLNQVPEIIKGEKEQEKEEKKRKKKIKKKQKKKKNKKKNKSLIIIKKNIQKRQKRKKK